MASEAQIAAFADLEETRKNWKNSGHPSDKTCEDCPAIVTVENIAEKWADEGEVCQPCYTKRMETPYQEEPQEDFGADMGIGPSDPYEYYE